MRLWRTLENLRGWSGVRAAWREHMGDELEFLQPLLRPMDDLALMLPRPGNVDSYRVVEHAEGHIVAVDPETFDAVPIDREDVIIWRLDTEALFRGVAGALGLVGEPASVGTGSRLWWLGEFVPI
ncbi:MAG: hypothetical protein FJ102_20670, partial [Deltaproteobacteria bacterium]|nr:hypothetical protein [Deltaproteobacteria bacterium]